MQQLNRAEYDGEFLSNSLVNLGAPGVCGRHRLKAVGLMPAHRRRLTTNDHTSVGSDCESFDYPPGNSKGGSRSQLGVVGTPLKRSAIHCIPRSPSTK